MAVVEPFRALSYDERVAGPLERLIAPPYDVIAPAERDELRGRSPYNVVHLTLPETAEDAVARLRSWRGDGVLARDEAPSFWVLTQDYVGPDGVARMRTGIVAALRVEPYENRVVLPHERTHRGPKEDRLRLLRAVRTQLEPIFLLYDADAVAAPPDRAADVEAGGARLWRVDDDVADSFRDLQLLIADGHHRYETALAYHAEQGTPESALMLVVLVSTRDPGLTIFPTHRVFARSANGRWRGSVERDPETALRKLSTFPLDRPAVVRYAGGETVIATEEERLLDVQFVDRLGHDGISYTPDWREAVRQVDEGSAAVAYLLRPTPIEAVFEHARRGDTLPQKTTYFYPKLLSGLLLLPLE